MTSRSVTAASATTTTAADDDADNSDTATVTSSSASSSYLLPLASTAGTMSVANECAVVATAAAAAVDKLTAPAATTAQTCTDSQTSIDTHNKYSCSSSSSSTSGASSSTSSSSESAPVTPVNRLTPPSPATFFRDGLHTVFSYLTLANTARASRVNRHWHTCAVSAPCKSVRVLVCRRELHTFTALTACTANVRHVTSLSLVSDEITATHLSLLARLARLSRLTIDVNEAICTFFSSEIQQQPQMQQQQHSTPPTLLLLPPTITDLKLSFDCFLQPQPGACTALYESIATSCTRLQRLRVNENDRMSTVSLAPFQRCNDLRTLDYSASYDRNLQEVVSAIRMLPHLSECTLSNNGDSTTAALLSALEAQQCVWSATLAQFNVSGNVYRFEWKADDIRHLAELFPNLHSLPHGSLHAAMQNIPVYFDCYLPPPPLSAAAFATILHDSPSLRHVLHLTVHDKEWSQTEWMSVLSQFDRLITLAINRCDIPSFEFLKHMQHLSSLTLDRCDLSAVQAKQLTTFIPASVSELHYSHKHAQLNDKSAAILHRHLRPKRCEVVVWVS